MKTIDKILTMKECGFLVMHSPLVLDCKNFEASDDILKDIENIKKDFQRNIKMCNIIWKKVNKELVEKEENSQISFMEQEYYRKNEILRT